MSDPHQQAIDPSKKAVKRTGKKKSKPAPAPAAGDAGADQDIRPYEKGVGAVVIRNEYYRDGYRTLQKVVLFLVVSIIMLIGAMYYVISVHQPQDRYFATTVDGRLVPMVSLSQPNLSNPALMSWVAQAATEVLTFGFHDYRRRLQESSRNFTRTGWESFTTALERSSILEMVQNNRQVVTAAPRAAPVLLWEGLENGRYSWRIEIPLIVTYQSGSQRKTDSLRVTLTVVRVPKLESPNGVGIEQWISFYG
jgi:intracellular multiplication protein IcmL|tara:strand:- start:63423 stop:64175 length:753 start_codon:yes stop_codon:yes gene_type:complete